jgi:hypothetical protein
MYGVVVCDFKVSRGVIDQQPLVMCHWLPYSRLLHVWRAQEDNT